MRAGLRSEDIATVVVLFIFAGFNLTLLIVGGLTVLEPIKTIKAKIADRYEKKRLPKISKEMTDAGYKISNKLLLTTPRVKEVSVSEFIARFSSDKNFILYDTDTMRYFSPALVYKRITNLEMECLSKLEDERLSEILKVRLDDIPLNNDVTPSDVLDSKNQTPRSKKSLWNVYPWDIEDEQQYQRRVALSLVILENLGLDFETVKQESLSRKSYKYANIVRDKIYSLNGGVKNV